MGHLFLSHIGAHHTGYLKQTARRYRSTNYWWCFEIQRGNIRSLSLIYAFILLTQTLVVLDMSSNEIGDIGAQYLANALKHNTVSLHSRSLLHALLFYS